MFAVAKAPINAELFHKLSKGYRAVFIIKGKRLERNGISNVAGNNNKVGLFGAYHRFHGFNDLLVVVYR